MGHKGPVKKTCVLGLKVLKPDYYSDIFNCIQALPNTKRHIQCYQTPLSFVDGKMYSGSRQNMYVQCYIKNNT